AKNKGMERLATKPKNAALIAFSDPTEAAVKSFRNLGNVKTAAVRELNPVSVLGSSYLVIENPEAAFAILETRIKGKKLGAPSEPSTESKPRTAKKKATSTKRKASA